MRLLILFFLGAIFFIGCANKYTVIYNTDPSGATIRCAGENKGYSPVRLSYDINESHRKKGLLFTPPCFAHWISGFKKDFNNKWDLKKFPYKATQILTRPYKGKGYEKDLKFSIEIERMKYQKQQAQAALRSAQAEEEQVLDERIKSIRHRRNLYLKYEY